MGYFKRPIRRGAARREWLALIGPSRDVPGAGWRRWTPSVPPAADQFLRFVVEDAGAARLGLFRSSDLLDGAEELPAAARSQMRATFRWFNANLAAPRRLPRNAVCWFRADATEALARLRTLIEIYRLAGRTVWMRATLNPGRVVYRDEHQVAAVPYGDRRTTVSVV
jgi:hypothetical protein